MGLVDPKVEAAGGSGDGWSTVLDLDLAAYDDLDLTTLTNAAYSTVGDLPMFVENLGVSGSADMVNGTGLVLAGVDVTARVALKIHDMLTSWNGTKDQLELTLHIPTFSMTGDGTFGGFFLQWNTEGNYAGTACGGYIHDATTAYRYGVNHSGNGTRVERGLNPGWTQTAGPWVRFRVGAEGVLFYAATTEGGLDLDSALVGRVARDVADVAPYGAWTTSEAPTYFIFLPVNCTTASMTVSSLKLRHRPG